MLVLRFPLSAKELAAQYTGSHQISARLQYFLVIGVKMFFKALLCLLAASVGVLGSVEDGPRTEGAESVRLASPPPLPPVFDSPRIIATDSSVFSHTGKRLTPRSLLAAAALIVLALVLTCVAVGRAKAARGEKSAEEVLSETMEEEEEGDIQAKGEIEKEGEGEGEKEKEKEKEKEGEKQGLPILPIFVGAAAAATFIKLGLGPVGAALLFPAALAAAFFELFDD